MQRRVAGWSWKVASAATVAFALAVAACGGDDDDAGGGTTAPAGTTAGSSGPVADDEIDPTARFRWANGVGLTRFDPHRASSSNDNTHLFLTYDRLIHQEPTAPPSAAWPNRGRSTRTAPSSSCSCARGSRSTTAPRSMPTP